MKKPLIGITLDNEDGGNYSNFPWYAIRQNYLHSIEKLGGIPFPLLHTNNNIFDIFNLLDGLIITGGNFDISPKLYGQKSHNSRNIKDLRTNFEISICKIFLESTKPILGICGGEQLMNVVCGGTLIQDIQKSNTKALEHEQTNPRDQVSHIVKVVDNTSLKKIVKKSIISVNSAHHQSVDRLGKNLISNGYSTDGVIESIEHTIHKWCIGVQWHPEFLITNEDQRLLKSFINKAKNI